MKSILTAIAIIMLFATAVQAAPVAKNLIVTMTDQSAAWATRCEAEDALKNLPPHEVLEALLPHIKAMPTGGIYNGGGRDFDKKAPVNWQVFYAISRSWNVAVAQLPRDTGGALLLSLLSQAKTSETQRRILMDMMHRWVPQAEVPVAALLKSPDADLLVKTTAANVLILHGNADYRNLLVEYAQQGDFNERKRWFALLSGPRKKCVGIDPRVVQIGFSLILEDRIKSPNYVHGAYFLALQTGDYLGETFQPDQHKPQYQGEHGLTDSFFADTVANAITWWTKNRIEVEKKLQTRQVQ